MMINERHVSDNEMTWKVKAHRGGYQIVSVSTYMNLDDANKIKELIVLDFQIVQVLQDIRDNESKTSTFHNPDSNQRIELENRLELLINQVCNLQKHSGDKH